MYEAHFGHLGPAVTILDQDIVLNREEKHSISRRANMKSVSIFASLQLFKGEDNDTKEPCIPYEPNRIKWMIY